MRHRSVTGHPRTRTPGPRRWRSLTLRYGVAVASVAVTLVVARLAEPLTGQWEVWALLCFAPVMLGAWHGGLGPGLLATGCVAGAMAYDGCPRRALGGAACPAR